MSLLRDITNTNENSPKKREHNKSGKTVLNVGLWNDNEFEKYKCLYESMPKLERQADGRGHCSPCVRIHVADGRLTKNRKKVCHAYHIVARDKFGKAKMQTIASSKRQGDITVSHLYGTANCCNPKHLTLESKAINDERTKCHHVLFDNYFKINGTNLPKEEVKKFCMHKPVCGSDDSSM